MNLMYSTKELLGSICTQLYDWCTFANKVNILQIQFIIQAFQNPAQKQYRWVFLLLRACQDLTVIVIL